MSDLIDTTEMYLRTVYELEEEGVVPLRARIAQRLHQSGPTVSQTVARMERDGLLTVEGDRHLELTAEGRTLAIRVMRKHRLAECLLVDVIGLEWDQVHTEACRWEHVMSEAVERRIVEMLDHPTESPYGNPIPGLDEFGEPRGDGAYLDGLVPLSALAAAARSGQELEVVVRRISEPLQADPVAMAALRRAGVRPGAAVAVVGTSGTSAGTSAGTAAGTASAALSGVRVGTGADAVELGPEVSAHLFVRPADPQRPDSAE